MTEEEFFKRYTYNVQKNNIGGGSFGTVYKAYDNILDREVAIKVSEVKVVGDKEFSLLVEFEAIAHLPMSMYIANYEGVFRFVERNGTYDYAVMQYYSLGNLSHYLKKNEVSSTKRESITKAILEGIAFLHQHKVVHRDLKPSNILVVDRQGEIIPKITDFGLSKQAEADGKASRFTNSFAGGTLQYSSPEQLKGLPLKLNTDLWSFGAIAYEILTGKTLFEAQSQSTASAEWQNEITQKILHADVSKELEILPQNWRAVVSACLEKDVNNRVQDSAVLFSMLSGAEKPKEQKVSDAQTVVKEANKERNSSKKSSTANNDETLIIGSQKPNHDKLTKENALQLLGLQEPFTKGKLEDAFRIHKNKCKKGIKDAINTDNAESFKKALSKLEHAYTLLSPLARAPIAKAIPQKQGGVKDNKKPSLFVWGILAVAIIAIGLFFIKPWEPSIDPGIQKQFTTVKAEANLLAKEQRWQEALNKYNDANNLLIEKTVQDSIASISSRIEEIAKAKETEAWEVAKKSNTIKSYNAYKTAYQQGIFVDKANANILILTDEVNTLTKLKEKAANEKLDLDAWIKAKKENTNGAYNTYLTSFSQGKYKDEAKKAIAELKNKDKLIANEKSSLGNTNKWLLEVNSYKNTTKSLTKVFNQIKNYRTDEGKARLSYLYLTGKGVKKDLKKANDLSLQPAKNNNGLAQYVQGAVLHRGGYHNNLKRNSEVFKWISLAAENNIYLAYNLKAYYHIYVGRNIKEDRGLGMEYLRKSVAIGSVEAVEDIAKLYTTDAVVKKENIAKAIEWQKKVTKLKPNDGYAHFQLAHIYFWTDAGSWKDYYNSLKISAERGNVEGMYRLGAALKSGMGTKVNTTEAIKWFKKSVDKGYKGEKELKALGVNYTPKK